MIPEELAGELSDLAGFRNVLVHVYWGLNLAEFHQILQMIYRSCCPSGMKRWNCRVSS